MTNEPQVVELRRYTLHPGQRDTLIQLFESELVEPQERCGMDVLGTFTDVERADQFVWLRGFADASRRAQSLQEFYTGPVWKQHSSAANATMIDSDNVLLLEPHRPSDARSGLARVYTFVTNVTDSTTDSLRALADEIGSHLDRVLDVPVDLYVTSAISNDFPVLPVRDDQVVVAWAWFADEQAHGAALERLAHDEEWAAVRRTLASHVTREESASLRPTPRSLTH